MRFLKYFVPVWMTAVLAFGLFMPIPDIDILRQTARNLFFHVPMWFTMFVCFGISFWHSMKYLSNQEKRSDQIAYSSALVGVMFGIAGLVTGSIWARFTWGAWWTFAEPRMNLSAIALLILIAYFILRTAFNDEQKRAKMAAVYNIFAVSTIPFLLYIIPRQLPSLHPGADGNPAFSEITAPELRLVFYPAVIGFIALSIWIINLVYRYQRLESLQQNEF